MSTESGGTAQPLRVGLIGAGPWASQFHAPMLAAGQETTLVAVWSRDAVKASTLAREHGAVSVPTFEALLAACSAVAFAVPPAVQPMLAAQAAAAGKHLLLEKPAALTVADARRLCEAVDDAGVVSQLVLPYRYFPRVVAFADAAAGFPTSGVQSSMISGVLAAEGPFATAWRRSEGVLPDLGPHALDLLELVAGTIVALHGRGDPQGWVALITEHATSAIGNLSLSLSVPGADGRLRCCLFGPDGRLELSQPRDDADARSELATAAAALRADFVARVRRGAPGPMDVHHALHLQSLLAAALAALRA